MNNGLPAPRYSSLASSLLLDLTYLHHGAVPADRPLRFLRLLSLRESSILLYSNHQANSHKNVWKALRTPLNSVPGPWYNKFTGLATLYASLVQFRQAQHLHELHQQYGPFVRTGPNEVDIADITCFQEIHRLGSRYVKSDFYHFLSPIEGGKRPFGVFQMTDDQEHSKRRRVLGKGFSVSYLRTNWEETVRAKVEAAVRGMKSDAVVGNNSPDIRKWCILMASDVISHLMFGRSFDGLNVGKVRILNTTLIEV